MTLVDSKLKAVTPSSQCWLIVKNEHILNRHFCWILLTGVNYKRPIKVFHRHRCKISVFLNQKWESVTVVDKTKNDIG